MEIFKVILLAIEQGITELLPISSSAHLILTGKLVGFEANTYILAILHLGTTLAIVIYFAPTLFKEIFKKETSSFYLKIFVSTIPAAIVGFFLQSIIEGILRGEIFIALSLIFWGVVMILVERKYEEKLESNLREISWKQSLTMGFAQIIALIPGTSRSGITTIAGILSGVNKYSALQYSFLLGIPILLGTSIYGIYQYSPKEGFSIMHFIGILFSSVFAYLSLILLRNIKKEKWLSIFGYYRIFLGIVLLTILFFFN